MARKKMYKMCVEPRVTLEPQLVIMRCYYSYRKVFAEKLGVGKYGLIYAYIILLALNAVEWRVS